MSNEEFFNSFDELLKKSIKSGNINNVDIIYHTHNLKRLVDMYNYLSMKAYDDGCDYFMTMNDDIIIMSNHMFKILKFYIDTNYIPGFGTAGPRDLKEEYYRDFSQLNFVSRLHFKIFNYFYTPLLDNWGIDNWMCYVYSYFQSNYLVKSVHITNHNGVDVERYDADREWKMSIEKALLNGTITISKFFRDNGMFNYYRKPLDTYIYY